MSSLFSSIAHVLGFVLHNLYNLVWFNYGIAIVILTIIIRFLLLPFAIKSFKSMAQMSEIQPLVNELQRKYKNDKETLNKELMQLYQEKKVNPFGGCLPLLINFFILYSLFLVMTSPITYMFNIQEITKTNTFASNVAQGNYYKQVEFLEKLQKNPSIYKQLKAEIEKQNGGKNVIALMEARNLAHMNMYLLGINLGDVPKLNPPQQERQKYIILWIIPILACATTFLASKYGQMPTNSKEMTDMQKSMQTQMIIMMPLMTLYFSFLVPVALSVYWILGNLLQLIQQKALINIYVIKKEAK